MYILPTPFSFLTLTPVSFSYFPLLFHSKINSLLLLKYAKCNPQWGVSLRNLALLCSLPGLASFIPMWLTLVLLQSFVQISVNYCTTSWPPYLNSKSPISILYSLSSSLLYLHIICQHLIYYIIYLLIYLLSIIPIGLKAAWQLEIFIGFVSSCISCV